MGKLKKEWRSNTMNKMREYERGREDGLALPDELSNRAGLKPSNRNASSGVRPGYIPLWQ